MAAVHHALAAVHYGQRALRLRQGQQRFKWLPTAEYIGQLADCEQASARADQLRGLRQVDQAVAIQRQHHQLELTAQSQLLPGQQVGVMFQGADDDLIARLETVFRP